MSDYNSSLPVRTETNGDVAIKLVDATLVTQGASVDSNGSQKARIADASGNIITSGSQGTQQALDVELNFGNAVIDPRSIRALTSADIVTTQQGTSPWVTSDLADGPVSPGAAASKSLLGGGVYNSSAPTLTTGQQVALQTDSAGNLKVTLSADAVVINTKDSSDGSITGGAPGTTSMLGGLIYNTSLPTLTTGQQAAFQGDSSARLIISPLTNSSIVKSQLQDNAGNGITSAVAGSTRPLDVALRDGSGNLYTASNPVPVQLSPGEAGTEVNNYNTVASVAALGTSNHDYTITTAKIFKGSKFWASASGKLKIEVQTSADGVTFNTKWVGFNSTATPNITIDLNQFTISDSGTGSKIRIIRTNEDKSAMDVYSTISGVEV